MSRSEDQRQALHLLWEAARDERGVTLTADEVQSAWRAFMDDTQEKLRQRDELINYRLDDPTVRTEAVKACLEHTRRTGVSSVRNEDGTPSRAANVVGYALLRGAEAVQQEVDRYAELCLNY
jgi:hypothetical protein